MKKTKTDYTEVVFEAIDAGLTDADKINLLAGKVLWAMKFLETPSKTGMMIDEEGHLKDWYVDFRDALRSCGFAMRDRVPKEQAPQAETVKNKESKL